MPQYHSRDSSGREHGCRIGRPNGQAHRQARSRTELHAGSRLRACPVQRMLNRTLPTPRIRASVAKSALQVAGHFPRPASPCGACGPPTQAFSRRTARLKDARDSRRQRRVLRPLTERAFDAPQVDSGHSAPAPGASMCQCMCGVTPGAAAFART